VSDPVLATRGLTRRFGGLVAVSDVSLELQTGKLHALLGPNGAGKSTFINLLSGELAPSGGTITFRGQDVSRWTPDRRSRAGLGRSYQRTSVFLDLSVYENCRLAAQSRLPRAWDLLRNAYSSLSIREATDAALAAAGLPGRDPRLAKSLSHGERRQLEIGMVLATRPQALLLDEPLAGMGSEEAARIVELLRSLAPSHAILLVEHDMDAVFALADLITVMVNGQVLESGPPAQIRASPAVRHAYLGDGEARP
jgi:branched-chain amino acid transport system ATP-binding protein